MYNKCCVKNCSSRRKDVKLYVFPKSEIGLQKWLKFIDCDKLRSSCIEDLRKNYVCEKHFEKKFISSTRVRSRLRPDAYPTLFSRSEIASGISRKLYSHADITRTTQHDHNYLAKCSYVDDHNYCKNEALRGQTDSQTEADSVSFASIVSLSNATFEMPSTSTCENKSYTKKSNVSSPVVTTLPNITSIDLTPTSRSGNGATVKSSMLQRETACLPSLAQDFYDVIIILDLLNGAVVDSTPTLSTARRRLIFSKKSLTPNCRKLYKEFVKSKKQLQFSQRARRAMKFSKESSFLKMTQQMSPVLKKILWMQIKQCTKKANGRRFSKEEKIIALSIMKQSPKCYKFLQKIFILPSKSTLNKMIAEFKIEVGLNKNILEALKQEVSNWADEKKYCSVLFDEVALESALTYDKHKDEINGFVDLNGRSNEFADHALVFMLRGAVCKWQQPLAFYFCKGTTSGIQLKNIIKDVVVAIGNAGLLPIAFVCDQGTAFQSAIKSLQDDTRREQIIAGERIDEIITINEHKISVIFDPPHLIKGLRNNFLVKNIKYEGKISKWSDIVDVYKADCNHAQMRLMHKLNDEHVIPEKIKKMKVKNCTRVFSKTVAATLSYTAQFSQYADGRKVSATIKNTADTVSFFDDLFDSVNGTSLFSTKSKGKPLRQAVTEKSLHHNFWNEAINKIEKIRFVDNSGKETTVPTLKNWVTTLKSYQRLWQFFKTKNIKTMRPRYFNSDPLENFFGQVRAYNFRNNNPSCHNFESTFKSLLITRFIKFHSETYNCEEDSGEQLIKIKSLFEKNEIHNNINVCSLESSESCNNTQGNNHDTNVKNSASQERLNVHSRAYTAGWVTRKINRLFNCVHCNKNMTATNKNAQNKDSIHNWIAFKEFKGRNDQKLAYPSEYALRLFSAIMKETNIHLENRPQQKDILKNIKNIVKSKYNYLFSFLDCEIHKNAVVEYFLDITMRLAVFNWCCIINKILKGTDVFRLQKLNLPPMQSKAFNKYKTKLKNKRINK